MKPRFIHIFKFIFLFGFLGFIIGLTVFFLSGWRFYFHSFTDIRYIYNPDTQLRLVGSVMNPECNKKGNILILHGSTVFGRKLALYRMLGKELAKKGYEVASFDFRGYGESDDPKKMSFSEYDLRKDITVITKALKWDTYHIIGHSLGASIAMNAVAKTKTDGVLSIISIGPSRRVYDRMLKPFAKEFEYARVRFQEDMMLKQVFDDSLLRYFLENLNIDNALGYFKSHNHCPLFLIDCELECKPDLDYLSNYYNQIINPKNYYTVPLSNHYFMIKSFMTRHRLTRFMNWDIIIYKKLIFGNIFNQILSWLDEFV